MDFPLSGVVNPDVHMLEVIWQVAWVIQWVEYAKMILGLEMTIREWQALYSLWLAFTLLWFLNFSKTFILLFTCQFRIDSIPCLCCSLPLIFLASFLASVSGMPTLSVAGSPHVAHHFPFFLVKSP